jgi:hypothetical protein
MLATATADEHDAAPQCDKGKRSGSTDAGVSPVEAGRLIE